MNVTYGVLLKKQSIKHEFWLLRNTKEKNIFRKNKRNSF